MNRNKFYILLLIICVSAFSVSLYLLPTKPETAYMYLHDKQYEKSYEHFRLLYESGDRSVDVVIPMVNLLLEYAQIDTAVDLMENFVEKNPNSVDALNYLAKTYKQSNRTYDYLRTLEAIYELQPSVEILREREKYYGYAGDLESEVEALKTLVSKYKPTEMEYLELAYQYASRGDSKNALETILLFLEQTEISALDLPTVSFAIDLLAEQKKETQAFLLAEAYYKTYPTKTVALGVLYALQREGLYESGLKFLNQLPTELQQLTVFRSVRVELYLSGGFPLIAYKLLKEYFLADEFPPNLYAEFIELAIQYKEMEILEAVLAETHVDTLSDTLLMRAILTVYIFDREDIFKRMTGLLDEEFITNYPALELELAILDSSLTMEEKQLLFSRYDYGNLSKNQLVVLAEAARTLGDIPTAVNFLKAVSSLDELDEEHLELLTQLLIDTKLADYGMKLVQTTIQDNEVEDRYERFWLVMAAANNQQDEIESWFNEQEILKEDIIKEAFYASYGYEHASLSMMLAKKINDLRPINENKIILAKAYLLNGYPENAFNITRELLSSDISVAELYINSLILLSSEKPDYGQYLDRAVEGFMKHRLLPDPSWRNLGYLMLDHQKRDLAASVFAQLAEGKSIDSPDMDSLLWIWGSDLTEEQQQWVLSHAMAASGEEKAKWLQHFLNIENPELVFKVVSVDDFDDEAITDRYIQALIMAKQKVKLKEVIAQLILRESRLPRLKMLGQLAYDEGLSGVAETAFIQVLEQDPQDQDAIRLLGYMYYFQGDYSKALPLLQKVKKEVVAYYYLGEIFQIKGWIGFASDYYLCAYHQYCKLEKPTDDQKTVFATVLFRLGHYREALVLYQQLLNKNPDNQYLIAGYANLLIDLGELNAAKHLLWKPLDKPPIESLLLARIRYYSDSLCFYQALRLSEEVSRQFPESGQVRAVQASLDWTLKKWRKAFCSIRNARALEPKNESYCLTQREMLRTQRPETMASFEYRTTGTDQYERYGYFSYRQPLNPANLLYFRLDIDNINVDNYVNIVTGDLEKRRAKRYKGEASWIHRLWYGGVLTSSIYYNGDGLGAGALYLHPDLYGSTTAVIEYRRPNWDFTQTIIEEGNRDRIAFKRFQSVLPRFEVSLGAGLNRYSLKGLSNAATSWTLEGGATYTLSRGNPVRCLMGNEGVVSFNYYLDAEYKIEEKERLNAFDQPFSPLPLVSRETHAAILFLAKRFGKCLAADGYGGLSYDREAGGNPVPIWGSQVFFGDLDRFHGRLEYSHSTSTEFSTESVDRYLIDLRWLW